MGVGHNFRFECGDLFFDGGLNADNVCLSYIPEPPGVAYAFLPIGTHTFAFYPKSDESSYVAASNGGMLPPDSSVAPTSQGSFTLDTSGYTLNLP